MKGTIKIRTLFVIPIMMFGFGYLMVPIYDVFCEVTGLNGKTGTISSAEASQLEVDDQRQIKVEFTATLNSGAPWDFAPTVRSMMIEPGKQYQTSYTATNQSDMAVIGQAVPSLAPAKASNYFKKTECFCFNQQKFEAKEQKDMPLIFVVDPDLPEGIDTVTLSYTFFDTTQTIN